MAKPGPKRRRSARRATEVAINDAVDWATDLGGGTRVALVQAGTFRSDAGALFGPVPRILWGRLVTNEQMKARIGQWTGH